MRHIVIALSLFALAGAGVTWGQDIGTWQEIAPLPAARASMGCVYSAATGKFYVVGGGQTGDNRDIPILEYDSDANTWTERCHLLTGVTAAGAVAVGQYIYVAGGSPDGANASDALQRFDPALNSVTTLTSMPAANQNHATTECNGKIYVLGSSASGGTGKTNYIYDIATDTWAEGAPIPTAIEKNAAVSDGTYVYVIGGDDNGETPVTTVQRYDPATNSWSFFSPLTTPRRFCGAFFDGKRLWAVGGSNGDISLASTEYNETGVWVAGPSCLAAAVNAGIAYSVQKGIAIKAGGYSGALLASAEKLSIAQPAPTPAPGVTLTLNSTSLNPNDTFTVDLTVQPLTDKFDAWGVIAGPNGIMFSFVLGKPADLLEGGKAMATNVTGLPTAFVGQIFNIKIPAGVAGDYTVIFELVPAGTPPIAPIANFESRKPFTVH